jgi:hypothetical protein
MISTIVVGLGLIALVLGSFASEIYLAKKVSIEKVNINHAHHKSPSGF